MFGAVSTGEVTVESVAAQKKATRNQKLVVSKSFGTSAKLRTLLSFEANSGSKCNTVTEA